MAASGQVFWFYFAMILLVVVKWFFGTIFVFSRKQIGKSVGRLVLYMFGLKNLSWYLLGCNYYFLFVSCLCFYNVP